MRAARRVRRRRDPRRRRHVDQHECQRGHREHRAGALGHQQGRVRVPAPERARQPRQSTNDAYPTAVRMAVMLLGHIPARASRQATAFAPRLTSSHDVLKMGRTQLQDAVPMTLVRNSATFAVMLGEDRRRLTLGPANADEVNLAPPRSAPASTPPRFLGPGRRAPRADHRSPLVRRADLIEATPGLPAPSSSCPACSSASRSSCRRSATTCACSRAARAPASTRSTCPPVSRARIMPGKVNPVIPEVVNQVAFQVIGNDLTVTMAAEAGQLQLNVMEPVIAIRSSSRSTPARRDGSCCASTASSASRPT